MNQRPINTLEEDFRQLGLLTEQDESPGAPDKKAQALAKKAAVIKKKQLDIQKKQMKLQNSRDVEDWEDEDGEELDEAMKKIKRLKGVLKIKARKAAKKFYRKFKAKIARLKKTAKYKRRRKKLAKMKKAPKGYRRMLPNSRQHDNMPLQIEGIGDAIDALRFDNRAQQLEAAFLDLARLAKVTGSSYMELSEDYLSTTMDFSVVAEACEGIVNEARRWAEALNEHDDYIRVTDQELIENRISELVGELDDIMEMHDDIRAIIDVDEGLVEDDDEELEEGMAFMGNIMAPAQEYGERTYSGPVKGWKNAEMHEIGNVMHPLGLQVGIRRLSDDEKKNLQGLGYGVGLGEEPY